MRRRRAPRSGLTPSLFPFLAVLICTMGALIALLVLGVQQAHVHAEVVVQQHDERLEQQRQESDDQRLEQEDLAWQQEVLEQQRAEKTTELATRRLELSHLENHLRELQGNWRRLQEKIRAFEEMGRQHAGQSQDWQAQREQLEKQIQKARDELHVLRQEAAQAASGYAIVIYKGSQGTQRQPVYLECTKNGISIHPGGVQISQKDLAGPGGPGNPLDACLRTIREYLVQQGVSQEEPYPLLLVRPDAVFTYALAREAMRSWEDEFGYELIEKAVPLKFSPPDEHLKALLLQTIEDARQRQVSLARAMPSRFSDGSSNQYRASNSARLPQRVKKRTASTSGKGFGTGSFGGAGGDPNQGLATSSSQPDSSNTTQYEQPGQPGDQADQQSVVGEGDGGSAIAPQNRQVGWGLPKQRLGVTAVSRPVRVICTTDRLIIVPGRYERLAPFTTHTAGNVNTSLDRFVAALWDYMENWGIAVAGGYWKPILNVEVRPGAESHFETLKTLLTSSGIEVQRK